MNIANYLGQMAKVRPAIHVAREIDEEIDFHIESHVKDLVRQGFNEQEARARTMEKFGDRRQIASQCRKIQTAPARWLAWIAGTAALIAVAVIGWLGWSLASLKKENARLAEQMVLALASADSPGLAGTPAIPVPQDDSKTLSGKVLDTEGNPVVGAKVLLIHKTWRGGYGQAGHSTGTGEDGAWKFEELYQTDIQNAFLVTIVADGYEMKSDYSLYKAGKSPGDIDFKLKPAPKKVFTFQDADGNPLPENDVVLISRKTGTKEHMLYELNALEAKKVTDEEGNSEFSCVLNGDTATFGILVFGELQQVELKITDEETQVVKLKKKYPE